MSKIKLDNMATIKLVLNQDKWSKPVTSIIDVFGVDDKVAALGVKGISTDSKEAKDICDSLAKVVIEARDVLIFRVWLCDYQLDDEELAMVTAAAEGVISRNKYTHSAEVELVYYRSLYNAEDRDLLLHVTSKGSVGDTSCVPIRYMHKMTDGNEPTSDELLAAIEMLDKVIDNLMNSDMSTSNTAATPSDVIEMMKKTNEGGINELDDGQLETLHDLLDDVFNYDKNRNNNLN